MAIQYLLNLGLNMTNNYEKINFIDKNGLALDDDL